MAIYPIKMLKDENGQPFVPITHMSAVSGEEYTTTILSAEKQSAGHYKITNSDLSNNVLANKMIAVIFDDLIGVTYPAYLKINNDTEYAIYNSDGINYLRMNGFDSSILYLGLNNQKWCMVNVGTTSSAGGGHTITDNSGNVMTTRAVLNFKNLDVVDIPGNGATSVINNNWMLSPISGITGSITSSTWTNLTTAPIQIVESGTYEITIYIELNNINYVGKEIAVRIANNEEKWAYQYKRFKQDFNFVKTFSANSTFTPQIYIDPLTSTSVNTLTNCVIMVKKIHIKN